MKRFLILCNTYSQFINATHMKLTLFKKDVVDIILTDHTKGLQNVACRVKEIDNLFDKVMFLQTKQYCTHKDLLGYILDVKHVLLGDRHYSSFDEYKYDEIITYNIDYFVYVVMDRIRKNHKSVKLSRFEEGILSYNHEFSYPRLQYIEKMRRLINKPVWDNELDTFYCYFPSFYKGKGNVIRIPRIETDKEELASIMSYCFDITLDENAYKEKYIFFTSVYDFEGDTPIGEHQAVENIANLVGKDNLLVKLHPRDERELYIQEGYKVDSNSIIPWEVLQFHVDISRKVLFTVNSGSILSSALLFSKGATSYFIYNMCNYENNRLATESIERIEEIMSSPIAYEELSNVSTIGSLEELKRKIK